LYYSFNLNKTSLIRFFVKLWKVKLGRKDSGSDKLKLLDGRNPSDYSFAHYCKIRCFNVRSVSSIMWVCMKWVAKFIIFSWFLLAECPELAFFQAALRVSMFAIALIYFKARLFSLNFMHAWIMGMLGSSSW